MSTFSARCCVWVGEARRSDLLQLLAYRVSSVKLLKKRSPDILCHIRDEAAAGSIYSHITHKYRPKLDDRKHEGPFVLVFV